MKIDFKKPKYVLPLIALPFICLLYVIISNWSGKSKANVAQVSADSVKTDQINPDMPDVSKDVANSDIKDKFDALKETYKYDKDYSALNSIAGKEAAKNGTDIGSVYTEQDIEKLQADQSLDSLKKTIENNKQLLSRGMSRTLSAGKNSRSVNEGSEGGDYQSPSQNAQNVMEELRKLQQQRQQQASTYENQSPADKTQPDRMKDFREQMRIVDSMQKANNPVLATEQKNGLKAKTFDPSVDSSFKPLPVSLAKQAADGFNTVRAFQASESIRAILDQDEKVYAGSRVRIRLLDDITVGDNVIPKGSYIYGVISGFQTQRVNISISEIMYQGAPLPVSLDVFDTDGYLGLYVPGSNFREFTKEIGTQGTSGLSSVQVGDGDLTSSLVEKLFTTTGSSVANVIKKDKAFLKYNYIIYLKEKKK